MDMMGMGGMTGLGIGGRVEFIPFVSLESLWSAMYSAEYLYQMHVCRLY